LAQAGIIADAAHHIGQLYGVVRIEVLGCITTDFGQTRGFRHHRRTPRRHGLYRRHSKALEKGREDKHPRMGIEISHLFDAYVTSRMNKVTDALFIRLVT
jgi:hypothetical protein